MTNNAPAGSDYLAAVRATQERFTSAKQRFDELCSRADRLLGELEARRSARLSRAEPSDSDQQALDA